nr:hypothetical protein [Sorangium cellulosum]
MVPDGVAFALEVVVLAREPARRRPGIGDVLESIEAPDHVAVPVDLHEIDLVLRPVPRVALAGAAEHLPSGQELVGKAVQPVPELHLPAVHVDEQRPEVRGLEDRVPVPAAVGVIEGDPGGIDGRMAHASRLLAVVAARRWRWSRRDDVHGMYQGRKLREEGVAGCVVARRCCAASSRAAPPLARAHGARADPV